VEIVHVGGGSTEPDPRTRLKEYALLFPRLLRLVGRLVRDKRVPARPKAVLLVLGAYLVSPIDLVPDFIPGLGHVDDLIMVAYALDQIINRVPEEIVREHWDGDEDLLQLAREVLSLSNAVFPGRLKKRLRH
jgi:uncharacterized membrane protein YkvA (DUF1232 family)